MYNIIYNSIRVLSMAHSPFFLRPLFFVCGSFSAAGIFALAFADLSVTISFKGKVLI